MNSVSRLVCLALLLQICGIANSAAQSYKVVSQDNTSTGRLSQQEYDSIRNLLKTYSLLPLKDTIIFKYQYDVVPQGNIPRTLNDEIIQQNITKELRQLHSALAKRKNISLFDFIAPGPGADSILVYNNLGIVDADKNIQRLLMANSQSANAMILMPDKRFICLKDEDGWAALKLSPHDLQQLLQAGLAKQ